MTIEPRVRQQSDGQTDIQTDICPHTTTDNVVNTNQGLEVFLVLLNK